MGENNHDHDDVDTTDDNVDVDTDVDETEDDADTSQNNDANDADDDADDDTDGDDDADDTAEDGEDDDSEGNSDDTASSDTADDDDADDDVDDGAEPELRKPKAGASNAEWAAWRAQEKAKKDANDKSGDDKGGKDDDSEDTDDDLSPEDAAAIDKRISKRLEPFEKKAAEQEVEASIANFLTENPDLKPFAGKVKRFAMHPSRASIPIKAIFYEVAGDKLLQIGAKRGKAADIKAKKTKTGGGNATTDGKGSKSYTDMPLEDFGKELDAEKTKRRN